MPFLPPGWSVDFRDGQYRAVWPMKRRLIRAGGSAFRIRNNSTDPGGGGGGLAAPTKLNKSVLVSSVMNPRLPCWSPSRQSYPPLSRNLVADQPEPVRGAGRSGQTGPPHLDRRPMMQENAAIKDLRLASGRGCVPSPTEVSEVRGDRGRMRPMGLKKIVSKEVRME